MYIPNVSVKISFIYFPDFKIVTGDQDETKRKKECGKMSSQRTKGVKLHEHTDLHKNKIHEKQLTGSFSSYVVVMFNASPGHRQDQMMIIGSLLG